MFEPPKWFKWFYACVCSCVTVNVCAHSCKSMGNLFLWVISSGCGYADSLSHKDSVDSHVGIKLNIVHKFVFFSNISYNYKQKHHKTENKL